MLHKIISILSEKNIKDIDVYSLMNKATQDNDVSIAINTIFKKNVVENCLNKQNNVIYDKTDKKYK